MEKVRHSPDKSDQCTADAECREDEQKLKE